MTAVESDWRTAVRMVRHQVTTRRALGGVHAERTGRITI
jgi:hypothetical protein